MNPSSHIFDLKEGTPAPGDRHMEFREAALLAAMSGTPRTIGPIAVRPFTFADWSLLKRMRSQFVAGAKDATDDNVIDGVCLFLYLMSSARTLRQALEIGFNRSRQEVVMDALEEVGTVLPMTSMSGLVEAIYAYIAEATSTRVDVAAFPSSKKNEG